MHVQGCNRHWSYYLTKTKVKKRQYFLVLGTRKQSVGWRKNMLFYKDLCCFLVMKRAVDNPPPITHCTRGVLEESPAWTVLGGEEEVQRGLETLFPTQGPQLFCDGKVWPSSTQL